MVPLTALVIGLLVAILYWFLAVLPINPVAKQVMAGVGAVIVFILLLAVVGVLHLGPR